MGKLSRNNQSFILTVVFVFSILSAICGAYGGTLKDLVRNEDIINKALDDATTTLSPLEPLHNNLWVTHLKESHNNLIERWVSADSNVIFVLTKDQEKNLPSALYISYNYGKNFTNKTESFTIGDDPNSGFAQLDKFLCHPKYHEFCVFLDSTNMKIYYTNDTGDTIHRSDVEFHPNEVVFDGDTADKFIVLDTVDISRKLYITLDGGKTFKFIQEHIKAFYWNSGSGFSVFNDEPWKPEDNNIIISVRDPFNMTVISVPQLFADAKDFQIKGDFIFATIQSKEKKSLDLYISYQRGPFYKAEFQTELYLNKFHIADVTDRRIFVSVLHTDNLVNLYVSEISRNYTQYDFVLSLEQVFSYFPGGNWNNSWLEGATQESFTDLYRVKGIHGIYIVSKVNDLQVADIGPEHLVSLITFDHGASWSNITAPTEDENGESLYCSIRNNCSLRLHQKFSQLYPVTRSVGIISSESAPGIIMATGVMGNSLKGEGVFISRDAGVTWKKIFKGRYFYTFGDHGGVLVAVKLFKKEEITNSIMYSINDGIDWHSYQFNDQDLRIYGLTTQPSGNNTTFTIFGSLNEENQWIIITLDLVNIFPRSCTANDYTFWSPSPPKSSVSCILGMRDTFQRRLAHMNCHNGVGYTRLVKKELCVCSRRDYECDFGFVLSNNTCIKNNSGTFEPYAIPSQCKPGQFYRRTKGYKKIDGDMCTPSTYMMYEPDTIPCPLNQPTEFLMVAMKDKIAQIDLFTNLTVFPVKNQTNIIALEFDIKNNCLYWSDIEVDRIMRHCFDRPDIFEIIVSNDILSVEGMALDWISNVLFFVDKLGKKIEAVRTDLTTKGRMRTTILGPNVLYAPRGIAVHPRAGYLFWTDWDNRNPSISRSNLDGTDIRRLFTKPVVVWPNSVTVDEMAERIYWVDANMDYIGSADLNGEYFRRILSKDARVGHPFGIAVLKGNIYWDDWKAKAIFTADKDTGANITTINSFQYLFALKAFDSSTQYGNNACSYNHTGCETLCLGGPGNTFSCLCPNGFKKINNKCVQCPNGLEPTLNMTCPQKSGSCAETEYTCKNSVCIPSKWRCDGYDDCGDRSDEEDCAACDGKDCIKQNNCTGRQFQCANARCIEKTWVCDGDNDCEDGSDERNCTHTETVTVRNGSLINYFACNNASDAVQIPRGWVCDGEKDCLDGEDEDPATCKNNICPSYMVQCPNRKCIYKTWVCDKENDCGGDEAWDEKNCTDTNPINFPHTGSDKFASFTEQTTTPLPVNKTPKP